MYRRHEHRIREKDPTALPLRILCALLGLTFGFAGGRLYGPENLLPEDKKPVAAAGKAAEATGMGAPVRDRIQQVLRMDRDALAGLLAAIQQEYETGWQRAAVYLAILAVHVGRRRAAGEQQHLAATHIATEIGKLDAARFTGLLVGIATHIGEQAIHNAVQRVRVA